MVWACCWRSVDTRTYNAARICGSFLGYHRRRRPAQHQLVCLVPPVLPIWLLAGLPPDLEGAPHGCPPTADSGRRATPADHAAAAAAAATTPAEAGHGGSSRTCHLRSNHRAHRPLLQADARVDHAQTAASRPGRPVDLAGAGLLHPAAPGPRDRLRPAAAVGAAPTPAATVTLSGAAWFSAAVVHTGLAGCHAETRRALPRPAQGPLLGTCRAVPGDQEAPQETAHDGEGCLTGSAHPPHPPTSVDGQPSLPEGLNHKLRTCAS